MNSMILLRNTPHRFPQTFMNFDRAILQKYAKRFGGSSSSLPPTTLLVNTETSLTLFDKYPKATYHFLLLPRILTNSVFTVGDLANLHTLLSKRKKEEAKGLIEGLKKDAETVREMIEKEMLKKQGYKWDVWIGFHAVPSMVHLHLHVISSDLCSPSLKHKKHYNSFHPTLGFFLHIDEVLSWFEKGDGSFDEKIMSLRNNLHEPLLKKDLECWRCGQTFKTMPTLKEHLKREKEAEASKKKKALQEEERKGPEHDDIGEPSSKERQATPDERT